MAKTFLRNKLSHAEKKIPEFFFEVLLLILIAYMCQSMNRAQAADLDCAPLDPRQEISKEIAADVEGSARTLLKVGQVKGKIAGNFSKKIKTLQDKYPNSDELILKKNLLYFYCTYLNSSDNSQSTRKSKLSNG